MPSKYYLFILTLIFNVPFSFSQDSDDLAKEVQIRRTDYGVPHILAPSLKAVAFGLAYAELEDYGERVIQPLVAARGELAEMIGYEALDADYFNQLGYQRTVETYHQLDQNTRDMLEGFAAGVNFYLKTFPEKFSDYNKFHFTGFDVAATTTSVITPLNGVRFAEDLKRRKEIRDSLAAANGEGSNAWAFAPEKTASGHSILVRNPHLRWTAGYYEAQITVPGKLNFYGDFRIGRLFAIIGGFNERLGWATTNNNPDLEEYYALKADPEKADHFLMDGTSIPLERRFLTAKFKNGNALSSETREFWFTPFGPVIHRDEGKIYILKQAGDGEFRRGEQFVKMMLSKNLEEWKEAMRMQAITSSNYTYADADGNIFYVWNAGIPDINHPSGGDSVAVEVESSDNIWNHYVPFDKLPQLQNPEGGYLHNENDPFHFTNLNQILLPEQFPDHFPKPRLRRRSQHSLELIHNAEKLSLEDVVELKHSMKMLVADKVKDDLVRIVRASRPKRELKQAISHLERWDNTVRAESRGGVLFEKWVVLYSRKLKGKEFYKIPWVFEDPMNTPDGIANEKLAIEAFSQAVADVNKEFGSWDLAWGDVHRLRHGDLDLPVSGGPGGLGCFRVLWFSETKDGKRAIRGGDGWQLAVEFSDPPRAYSILAYGQSDDPDSPHHADQAEMFANNKMKRVAYTEKDIKKTLIRSYQPGN